MPPVINFLLKIKYLLDATVIDLRLSLFPRAEYRKRKGAIKLHMGIDADGYLPEFMDMTKGKFHEITWAKKMLTLPKRSGGKSSGIRNDQQIRLNGVEAPLRLVEYIDPETGREYRFLTNAHRLKASEVAALYKERWRIEQFFKWIKQNLRIKTFLGTSRNAVLTQVWIALCVYLMIAFLNFKAKLGVSMQRTLRVLQLNLFSRSNLEELFKPPNKQSVDSPQLSLWG